MSAWTDVTVSLRHGMPHWPDDQPFEIRRDHDMNQGAENNLSQFTTSAHAGTHMDAPLHFVNGAASIDQFPLEVAIGPARVIGIRNEREVIIDEVRAANIQAGERVLFKTRNSRMDWPAKPFQQDFVAVPDETAQYLASRKPALVGVDYLSVAPYQAGGPTHRTLLGAGIWVVEGLDLSEVEPGEYEFVCLPLKLAGAEGAPARAALRRIARQARE